MVTFIQKMGPFGIVLILMALAILVLIAVQLSRVLMGDAATRRRGNPNAILFWGALAAVLGFLGQYMGMYNGLQAIARASAISPSVVAMGLAESFTTTLFGLVIFVLSAVAWFVLGALDRRRGEPGLRGGTS